LKYLEPKRRSKPTVLWFHGETGTGKSKLARELSEELDKNAWWSGKTLDWFEGYDQHSCVVIDDFRPDQCEFAFLLRLLDRYPLRVPVKGGSREWVAETIIITAPEAPEVLFRGLLNEKVEQLLRRIDRVVHLTGTPEIVEDLDEIAMREEKLAAIDALLSVNVPLHTGWGGNNATPMGWLLPPCGGRPPQQP
jgi:Adenylylsulfate kinase and related kinases